MDLPADDGLDIMKHIRQVGLLLLQVDLAALDTAHIQNIVDEAQQVVAGGQDLGQVIFYLFRIVNIGQRQRGEADHRVHRGADIVGHIAEEDAFGFVG